MTKIETYLRYQDIFGIASTKGQFEDGMRALDIGLVLRLFSPVNTICSRDGLPDRDAAQIGLIREIFDPDTERLVRQHFLDHGQVIPVFHRKQCLFIMREAMRLCPDIPGMQPTSARGQLARISLMANEFASETTMLEPSDPFFATQMMCDFIPITEANELKFNMSSIPRMHKIVHEIAAARRNESPFFDIPALFEEVSGLPFETFEGLCLSILPRVVNSAKDVLTQSPFYGVPMDFFDQTGLSSKDRDIFFGLLVRTPDEFRERLRKTPATLSDFTIFKETPFLRNFDRLVPIDTTACIEKFETAVFFTVLRSLPNNKKKESFISFWAAVFEDYIDWLIANSVDHRLNKFYPSPRYLENNRQEVCDGILISGQTAVFIECKGGFMRKEAKYGGNPVALREEIEKKYVAPKGVYQLAHSIVTALNKSNRPMIEGIDLSEVRTVMPLLITRDDIGDGFFVNSYLNSRFDDAKRETNLSGEVSPIYCTKLISISVDVIEKISPFLSDTRMGAILADRLMSDPALLAPFFMKEVHSITSKPARPPLLLKAINPELSRTAARFLKVDQQANDAVGGSNSSS